MLLHRLQKRGLGLGRCAVDLVGEQQVGEHRALHEAEDVPAGRAVLVQHLGAGDVGRHQVGRELNAAEAEVHHLGERPHEQRLRKTGDASEERMPAREHRGKDLVDHLLLADHALRELPPDLRTLRVQRLDATYVAFVESFVHFLFSSPVSSASTVSSRW